MTSKKVAEKCQEKIDKIMTKRKALDEEFLKAAVENANKWRKKIGLRLKTEDEVRQKIIADIWTWGTFPSVYGWGTLETAERLLKAAKLSVDGQVQISSKDVQTIWGN